MKWYVGPWQWNTGDRPHWSPPDSAVSALDLRSIPQQSTAVVQDGFGIFASHDELSSDYELLGTGSLRGVKTSQRLTDRIPKRDRKRQPKGDDLLSLLLDAICDGSDPTGDSFAKPLMPDSDMRLSLSIGGETHQWKTAPWNYHWDKIQDVERADFQRHFGDAKAGRLKDSEHHRRILDALCDKYNLQGTDDWKGFVPAKIRKDIPGRLQHETTLTDTFDRANAGSLGTASGGWSWANVTGSIGIVTNKGSVSALVSGEASARAQSDLSSSDMYVQCDLAAIAATVQSGPRCRYSTSAVTLYEFLCGGTSVANIYTLWKYVAGTTTRISNVPTTGASSFSAARITANGSSISGSVGGSTVIGPVTDTAISGNTRGGIISYTVTGTTFDNFTAEDIAGSSFTYTQLERSIRGYARGVWSKY